MKDNYYLEVSVSGLGIVIELNGVPIVKELNGEGYQEALPVNSWLRKSVNTLSVSLLPPVPYEDEDEDEDEYPQPIGEQVAIVKLFLNQAGSQSIEVAKVLSVFTWPLLDIPSLVPYQFKDVIREPIVMPSGMTLWNQTKVINTLSPRDRQFMFESIQHFSSLLLAKNYDQAFKFMGLKFNDQALTSIHPASELKAAVVEMWEHLLSMEEVKLQTVGLQDLKFEVVGDGHLVEVTRIDGAPAIMFEDVDEEMMYGIPLYFGMVNEQWRILR